MEAEVGTSAVVGHEELLRSQFADDLARVGILRHRGGHFRSERRQQRARHQDAPTLRIEMIEEFVCEIVERRRARPR